MLLHISTLTILFQQLLLIMLLILNSECYVNRKFAIPAQNNHYDDTVGLEYAVCKRGCANSQDYHALGPITYYPKHQNLLFS